jgi:hypothetical protein
VVDIYTIKPPPFKKLHTVYYLTLHRIKVVQISK